MIIELKIPSAGESITEVAIGNWMAEDGDWIEKDQEIAEVETDKATLPLIAPEAGKLKILVNTGVKVNVGDIACTIDTEGEGKASVNRGRKQRQEAVAASATASVSTKQQEKKKKVAAGSSGGLRKEAGAKSSGSEQLEGKNAEIRVTPLAHRIMEENALDVDDIINGLRKITRHDVETVISNRVKSPSPAPNGHSSDRSTTKVPMSPLRRKLSKRLVAVKNETAMLTTFNEVDMSAVMALRKKNQMAFQEKHGLKLGLMSFFTRACAEALQLFPKINSMIDGDDIVTPDFVDIAIAVQTDKGLMVPVIRNAHKLGIVGLEISIDELARKAREGKLSIEDMTGGTFTITNGGVFGSMLSTPIINPPQSAILGMHNIVERPVAVDGNMVIRPIMYVALSYDHRLIDGRDSVSFLVKVKELIEEPMKMVLEGADPEKILLEL